MSHVFWRIVGFVVDAGKAAGSWIATGVVVLFIGLLIFGWIGVIWDKLWAPWSLPAVVGVAWLFYILGGQKD